MEQDWTSNRAYIGNTIETDNHMFRTKYGWFFCDETQSDSFGPFETKEECMEKLKEYASQL